MAIWRRLPSWLRSPSPPAPHAIAEMAIWRRLQSWLPWFPWYRRRGREADLERELRDQLELEAEEQSAAGLSPQEAALLRTGNWATR